MKGLLVLLFLLQTGFLINVFKALSHRPAELRAFLNYHEVVMARSGKIPVHTGKCIRRFAGIYAYCRYFIDRKW